MELESLGSKLHASFKVNGTRIRYQWECVLRFEFEEMITYSFRYCYAVSLIMVMMQLHFEENL